MALGVDYAQQDCVIARSLELVGERWTLLVLRDCFFGVRRFTDLQAHLDISKAVLTDRLAGLVEAGLLERVPREPGARREDYQLTQKGLDLWPVLQALVGWGDRHASPHGPRRLFSHASCGTDLDLEGRCPVCAERPEVGDVVMRPGPGASVSRRTDPVSIALRAPHRLLEPLLAR